MECGGSRARKNSLCEYQRKTNCERNPIDRPDFVPPRLAREISRRRSGLSARSDANRTLAVSRFRGRRAGRYISPANEKKKKEEEITSRARARNSGENFPTGYADRSQGERERKRAAIRRSVVTLFRDGARRASPIHPRVIFATRLPLSRPTSSVPPSCYIGDSTPSAS